MTKSKYIVINEKDNSEINHDYIHFHGPPETDLISTYKGGFGDYYRTIWKLISQDNLKLIVKEF